MPCTAAASACTVVRHGTPRTTAAVRLGCDGTGVPSVSQQADDAGETDREQAGELAQGVFAAIHSGHDALTEVVGVRTHSRTSSRSPPNTYCTQATHS